MFAKAGFSLPAVAFFVSSLSDKGLFLSDETSQESLSAHWKNFLQTKKLAPKSVVFMEQVHGGDVQEVSEKEIPLVPGVDALVTNQPGIFLAVKSADCLPVLLMAQDGSAIAAIHAGYKGTLAHVTRNAVQRMEQMYGVSPMGLTAVLGPCICALCYDVSEAPDDRVSRFEAEFGAKTVVRNEGKVGLDIRLANRLILEQCGVLPHHISDIDDCTVHGVMNYPSHYDRRQTERLISIIGITHGR